MKLNLVLKSSLILSIFLFFLSCKNSEELNITPEEKLTTQIRGKWKLDDFPLIKFQTQINKNTRQNEIEIIPSVSSKIESSKGKKASLEFIDTENYILIDSNSAFWFGKYQVLSSTAILLERFGELAEIEVNERTLKFKSNYLGLN